MSENITVLQKTKEQQQHFKTSFLVSGTREMLMCFAPQGQQYQYELGAVYCRELKKKKHLQTCISLKNLGNILNSHGSLKEIQEGSSKFTNTKF